MVEQPFVEPRFDAVLEIFIGETFKINQGELANAFETEIDELLILEPTEMRSASFIAMSNRIRSGSIMLRTRTAA